MKTVDLKSLCNPYLELQCTRLRAYGPQLLTMTTILVSCSRSQPYQGRTQYGQGRQTRSQSWCHVLYRRQF